MHRFIDKFVIYCEQELDFEKSMVYGYKSLSVCIIDCVYSLRARYYETTIPVVDRYAEYFMDMQNILWKAINIVLEIQFLC